MSKSRIDSLLDGARWKFAKTLIHNPHHYTLRDTWESQEDFDATVMFIREHGVTERFGKRDYTVYYRDEYKYWTMGNPLEQTILINRKAVVHEFDRSALEHIQPLPDGNRYFGIIGNGTIRAVAVVDEGEREAAIMMMKTFDDDEHIYKLILHEIIEQMGGKTIHITGTFTADEMEHFRRKGFKISDRDGPVLKLTRRGGILSW